MSRFDLHGKVALVTGGGRGLGRGMALALAEAGAEVAVVSRSAGQLAESLKELQTRGGGGNHSAIPWDLAEVEGLPRLIEEVVERHGRLDILLNAAGTQVRKPILEVTPEDWETVQSVNLRAAFFISQAAARQMIAQGQGGKIIHVASLTSRIAVPGTGVYSASKSAILGLVRTMAVEWAAHNIQVNAVGPGYFHTDLTDALFRDPERRAWVLSRIPLGRAGIPEDLAGATVFLASAASDYVTGQTVFVDGGWLAG